MYAIVENGSKQYKAEVGSVIKFEKLDANVGDKVELKVLLVEDAGKVMVADEVKNYKAVGEVLEQGKDKKIVVYKYKPKKNERKKQGHRQPFTAVKILEISAAE
ncbi:MAG: 50S ribosomal protein L21 [Clostridiales bacterium]|nr:50S ribosomal protein L21 [Clostridiales bacterium]